MLQKCTASFQLKGSPTHFSSRTRYFLLSPLNSNQCALRAYDWKIRNILCKSIFELLKNVLTNSF